MIVAIAGASGFVGRALTTRLRGSGHDVIALGRSVGYLSTEAAAWLDGIAHAPAEVRDRFIFCYDEAGSRPWKPNYVTKRFIQFRKAAGLGHFRLHDLRHFMATQMLDVGVAVPIVAARLAHARASTTLNVYAHAVPGGDRHAAQQLAQRLAAAVSLQW